MPNAIAWVKRVGAAYLWGVLNFFVGAVCGSTMAFVAVVGVLKAKGLL